MPVAINRRPASRTVALDEIHLWSVDLAREHSRVDPAALAADERQRATHFAFERDRGRFLAARTAMRRVLSLYTGIEPRELRFSTQAHGKPVLSPKSSLRFNLSHSEDVALIGVVSQHELGVDLERRRLVPDAMELADRYFTAAEARALRAVDKAKRDEAFLVCWTRKEACAKATGLGLTLDTRSFDVGAEMAPATVLLDAGGERHEMHLMSYVGADAIAAVASTGPRRRIQHLVLD